MMRQRSGGSHSGGGSPDAILRESDCMPILQQSQAELRVRPAIQKSIVAVVLPFLLLYWADMWHHTMFFDEVNAWAISAASPTLSKLFYYVHFEGHPWLWYFILWFPTRVTHDPVALKWVEAVFGTANILIIGLLSPFRYRQRALILCSYFLMWEYTVMCRMYSVMLLFALLYVLRRVRKPEGVLGNCALLGLAANTDSTALLLSGALLLEYAYSSYFGVERKERRAVVRRWIAGVLAYAALVGLSVATLWPSKHISWQSSGHLGSQALEPHRIHRSVGDMIAAPWWPISPHFPHKFWWDGTITEAKWLYAAMPVVLFIYWKTLRRDRNLLLLMGSILLFGIVWADVVYEGHLRNWGISFVGFVIALWLQRGEGRERSGSAQGEWNRWTYGLFAVNALAGVLAIMSSWHRPFSRAREAGQWVEKNVAPNTLITGAVDVNFASMGEEMQRPMYFLECYCTDTFKLFSKDREDFDEKAIPSRINEALKRQGRQELMFVIFRPLYTEDFQRLAAAGLNVRGVKAFGGADMPNENFFFYEISKEAQHAGK